MLRLREDLYRRALQRLTGGSRLTFGVFEPKYRDWLMQKNVPEELREFLLANALSGVTSFAGLGGMWTPEDVMELNAQEEALSCSGLFGVGDTINGDFIVIDFGMGNGTAGYVSHDLLPEIEASGDARKGFHPVAKSIGEMLHGMTTVESFPYDYWQASHEPILYDADAVKEHREPCLGNTSKRIEEFIFFVRGSLIDGTEIEQREKLEDPYRRKWWAHSDLSWVHFAKSAQDWVNDLQTVVFNFGYQNIYSENPLVFAQKLLDLNPSEFECAMFDDRVYARMWWDRNSAAYSRVRAVSD
jgi:hypothetical protein